MAMRNIIVLGDGTTHGGKVISAWGADGSVPMTINGKPVACIGDKVTCPRCRGTHTIIQGAEGPPMKLNGKLIAREGDLTSCGAKLLSGGQTIASHGTEGGKAAKGAAAATAYGTGGPDRVVSLDDPDPSGFQKVGLFRPSPPRISNTAFEAYLCGLACDCMENRPPNLTPIDKGGTHQSCIDQKIRGQFYSIGNKTGRLYPRDDSPVWSEVSFHKYDAIMLEERFFGLGRPAPVYRKYDLVESRTYPGKPTSQHIVSGTWRLDVVKIGSNGKPEKMYDMKFPGDGIEEGRRKAYRAIAKKHTGNEENFDVFDVAKKCECMKQEKETQTQTERKSILEKARDIFRKPEKPIDFPPSPGAPKPPTKPPVILPPIPGLPPIRI
jgi:uncharacterized Zn-binding protein involved in type VI secretion